MTLLYYILIAVACYLIGGIPFSLIIGKLNGVDIRTKGSGNVGATNCGRLCGRKWGLLCFVLDFLKGFGPAIGAVLLADRLGLEQSACAVIGPVGTVGGHIYTPYLKFKGGKGIATSAGAICAVAWLPVVIAFVVWAAVVGLFRYVGLASVCAALALPMSALAVHKWTELGPLLSTPVLIMLAALGALTIWRHRSNLRRLLNGTETKIGSSKGKSEDENCCSE